MTIELGVTVERAAKDAWNTPVLNLGPDEHNFNWRLPESAPEVTNPLSDTPFDQVWVDRRGTGRSTPLPTCAGLEERSTQLQTASHSDELNQAIQDCVAAALDAVPTVASTLDHEVEAQDLTRVRQALGIDRWVVAYPMATVALHLVRLDADHIAGVLSNGQPTNSTPGEGAAAAKEAFDAFAADCATRPECSKFGDLHQAMADGFAGIGDGYDSTVNDATGRPVRLTAVSLLGGTRAALLDPSIGSALAGIIAGRAATLDVAAGFFNSTPFSASGNWNAYIVSVRCGEARWPNPPQIDPTNPFTQFSYAARCNAIGNLVAVANETPEVSSDVPVLVTTGAIGLLRLNAAKEAFAGFPNATFVESPGIISPVIELADCYVTVRNAFVADPTATVDTTCLSSPSTHTLS